jgi:serine/threonine protein kinase
MALSTDQFREQVFASGLLTEAELSAWLESLPEGKQPTDGEQLARELVKQKRLTKFQAEQIYAGKGKGLVLGNYTILDKLGQGGMGMVLKAEHKRLKRLVALKVLSPAALKTPDALKRFHREVEAAAKLRHTNVVATDDSDEAKGTHFLVMEYVEGSDLSALVKKKGPLSVEQALRCVVQAARGLEYAHEQGVVHRDIKPANLLLDAKGTVKVLDMGLARIEGHTAGQAELTSTGAVMGTVDYMAPEQALNTKAADARSDIYSLGISLWYLLTGKCAYDGDTLMSKLLAHRDAPIPSLSKVRGEVPEALDAVFQKMVAKLAKDRYQTMTEVIRELEACQNGTLSTTSLAGSSVESEANALSFLRSPGGTATSATRMAQPEDGRQARATATYLPTDVVADVVAEATTISGDVAKAGDTGTVTLESSGVGRKKRSPTRAVAAPPWWQGRSVLIGGGAAAVLLLLGVVILLQTPNGTLRVEILDPEVEMKVKGTELTFRAADLQPVTLKAGEKTLVVTRGDLTFETESFTLKKGPETRVKVELLEGKLVVTGGGRVIAEKWISPKGMASATGDKEAADNGAVATKSPTPSSTTPPPGNPPWPRQVSDLSPGFVPLFNGKDLTGWKGDVGDPKKRAAMTAEELAAAQAKADEKMRAHWRAENGVLLFDGKGDNLCTAQDYSDFELYLEWNIPAGGDSGVYLRGAPQVQIWDSAVKQYGNNMGSGGLFNNKQHPSKPLVNADKPIGEWNAMLIRMVGEKVTVSLNGQLVVDDVVFENALKRDQPIYPTGPIELQKFGSPLQFRNVLIRSLDARAGADAPPAAVAPFDAAQALAHQEAWAQLWACRWKSPVRRGSPCG